MIYDLTDYSFVQCERCGAIVGYENEDIIVRQISVYNPLECNTIKTIYRVVRCPKCMDYITIEKLELEGEEK